MSVEKWLFCVVSIADFRGVDPPFTAEIKVPMGWLCLAAASSTPGCSSEPVHPGLLRY